MTTEKMTIHKALVELKILDSRIMNEILKSNFCGVKKNVERVVNGVPVEKFNADVKAKYDKIGDLIKRREAIKRAVSNSNAITKVTVGGKEYTVAEAIEMNQHGLNYKTTLLNRLNEQYNHAVDSAAEENMELQNKTDKYVSDLYGAKEQKNSAEASKAAEEYRKNYECRIVDPINISDEIQKLHDEIDNFKSDVDSALSVSNAVTEIEISY